MMLALAANLVAAGLLAFTIFFYAVVYSMWLKRATPQNLVIGGAAGAFPPVIGWAVVTGGTSIEAWLMSALIFLWTPPHFWALALFMKDDYHRAGVPMLTVTHGRRATRTHILAYTVALVPVSLALALSSVGGPVTLAVALVLNAMFLQGAWAIRSRDEAAAEADGHAVEKRVFRFSLFYTFLHFGALMAETALAPFGLGGW
jgi:protoheme IX farnesyltransferase